jgi:hypothetical protein
MTSCQSYKSLVEKYKEAAQLMKKLGLSGGMIQFSILLFINGWKHLEIPYYKLVGLILFSWVIYSFLKDFLTFLKFEKKIAQMILDGVELEKRNTSFGNFFHEVLRDFNLVKVLSQRSLVNLVAVGCFGYFLSQFIADLNPSFAISPRLLVLISGVFTLLTYKLYYDSLKPLAETKVQALHFSL